MREVIFVLVTWILHPCESFKFTPTYLSATGVASERSEAYAKANAQFEASKALLAVCDRKGGDAVPYVTYTESGNACSKSEDFFICEQFANGTCVRADEEDEE